ncbi:CDP-alcohol phosphatidyltransferase family protein [Persicimonas caeni]|uniref:CDP-alcohol phosphatidyltransferase family protein n=1 Tax=Persicimonas caeni TaxID=2292766 RepID=A0A4Y6PWQ8_PERCE|nr:CDP-alcohol phosphatidyltransferase family protein [Persicimonas caeni]QDG52772.1 CDP-alcohol phosphatidyltransferase family protein [Persicimonas caeni]QED33994.1 CDP-alcohol phosphatidyltransferase family protein [Persicimonas caeni]
MSFRKQYRQALAFKDMDVEEPIDVRFHRPLAALVTVAALSTPVTPNQITISSLVAGWTGSFFLYQAFFGELWRQMGLDRPLLFVLAGFFLFASVILDCADGQLARARGGGSRVGRILDGFVDALVLLPAYVILGFGILQEFGQLWIWIAAVAGFSTWARTIVYDKMKRLYLARTNPSGGEASGIETPEEVRADYERAKRDGSLLERFLLLVYLGYLTVQDRLASGETHDDTRGRTLEEIAAFRQQHRGTMRLCSWMGLGTHMLLIYTSIAAAAIHLEVLIWGQAVLASVFNVLLAIVLVRGRKMQ